MRYSVRADGGAGRHARPFFLFLRQHQKRRGLHGGFSGDCSRDRNTTRQGFARRSRACCPSPKSWAALKPRLIPKLRNLDSCYPTLCANDRIVNVSQIKHMDGRHKPAATPQVGRG